MIPAYVRGGGQINICPHIKLASTRKVQGIPLYGEIRCTADCKAETTLAVTREGLRINICPHVKVNIIKSPSGMPLYANLYCNIDNVKGSKPNFEALTKTVSGLNIEALRKATHETIDDAKLYQNANLAIMLGLPKDELVELFKAATKLGYAVGIPTERAIEAVCKGVGRRSRLLLDNIGITFKPTDAYDWYKTKHGLDTLTNEQKTEAWQKYAIHQTKEHARKLG